jgi:hypothetical protein
LADLRRWDLVIALATTAIATLAYLLPTYASHTFGSWGDYLQLVAYGLLGAGVTGGPGVELGSLSQPPFLWDQLRAGQHSGDARQALAT